MIRKTVEDDLERISARRVYYTCRYGDAVDILKSRGYKKLADKTVRIPVIDCPTALAEDHNDFLCRVSRARGTELKYCVDHRCFDTVSPVMVNREYWVFDPD